MMLFYVALFIIILIIVYDNFVSRRRRDNTPPKPFEIDWSAIDDEILQAEIATSNKIGAIKRYRELTGLGLKESKDAIDYAIAILHPEERGGKKKKAAYDAQDAGIRDLIQAGRMDEAVEVYQKFAGVDVYTARDAVNEIAREVKPN